MAQVVVEMSGDEARLYRSYQRLIDQAAKLDQRVKDNKKTQEETFGDKAASQLGTLITRYGSMAAAIGGVLKVMRDVREESERMGQAQRTSGPGLGTLAQLAETPAQMAAIVQEAKKTFAEGGARTMQEAASMQFALESAGAAGMRADFSRLHATGLVPNAEQMVEAATKLQKAFGADKTGSLSRIVSTAFGGGKIGLGTAEQLLAGAAEAGTFAQRIGLSPEETMAAVATISGTLGPEGAATAAEQLFKNIEVQGIVQKKRLKRAAGLNEYLGQIQALEQRGVPINEILGNRAEAIVAYGLLTNTEGQGLYSQNMQNIAQAQQENWMQKKLSLAATIPENIGAMAAQVGENRGQLAASRVGTLENLADAIEEDMVRRARGRYGSVGANIERWGANLARYLGTEDFVQSNTSAASPQTQEMVRMFYDAAESLKRSADSLEDATGRQRAAAGQQVE